LRNELPVGSAVCERQLRRLVYAAAVELHRYMPQPRDVVAVLRELRHGLRFRQLQRWRLLDADELPDRLWKVRRIELHQPQQ
jgi:hypothetical protein